MIEVYREILPESYLLILADDQQAEETSPLAKALKKASNSGKRNVWVDCSHLHHLSASTVELLLKYNQKLRRRHMKMVLCHLDDTAQADVRRVPAAAKLPVVPTLLDADRLCHAAPRSTGNRATQ
ncbi:STAS domain-containing protein [Hymenobacter sp. BT175]|uniref:STAS domain-containing protein n=1 Tax=Hymenobacter translucens TaxID=2886507 RepID=UPI001D0E59BB|nr:STAS domain-containing protein [Hymenobacter translucens]MCC2547307.1 STAS domain-containing protein [Hymenobacter translucens]